MKKILLLGGSAQQVGVIKTAKKMGYCTVVCDYLEDNPGQYVADRFYLESTTDKEKILEIAIKEHIDAVLAYASDPAAPTAAYVSEKLGLSGNPYESVEILCNKDKFRRFLKENGFNSPKATGYDNVESVLKDCAEGKIEFPVIMKPVDSSGSKGTTVLRVGDEIKKATEFAFAFSRCHRIIVENYIEKKHQYLIGGDIFVVDGKIILWGLLNCHRDANVNPLVPVGKSYPLQIDKEDQKRIQDVLHLLVEKLQIKTGAMNIEAVIDKENRVWLIDVGPRSGGNMIPDLLGEMYRVDIAEMSIKAAAGEKITAMPVEPQHCYATYNLHSACNGKYNGLIISKEIEKYITKKCIYKKSGDEIERFDNASKCIGIVFMRFEKEDIMKNVMENINDKIKIRLVEK